MNQVEVRMYRILQETGLSDDRASEAVAVMKELQKQSTEHLATKNDLEQLASRLLEKMHEYQSDSVERINTFQNSNTERMSVFQNSMTKQMSVFQNSRNEQMSAFQNSMTKQMSTFQGDITEQMSALQTNMAEKMSNYHRNTVVWVVSTVATGVTITVGLISLAIRYL